MTKYNASRRAADATVETGIAHMAVPEWGYGWIVVSCEPDDFDGFDPPETHVALEVA